MKKFSEIEQFRSIYKTVEYFYGDNKPTLRFYGTVKLHGTNAGIRRKNGKFQAQSRTSIIDSSNDNAGFAAWVENLPYEVLHDVFDKATSFRHKDVTLFGEWIGPKIQKGVAINDLPEKQWVLFEAYNGENESYIDLPTHVEAPDYNIFNISRGGIYIIDVDFSKPEESLEKLINLTIEIEKECPYAKSFGVSGIGEGLVWKLSDNPENSNYWFKTKGEKHSGAKKNKKKIATIAPEKLETINTLLDEILPTWRLEQGLNESKKDNDILDMKNIGPYLAWINKDVRKEEMDTILENGLEWKEIAKFITQRAKTFFMNEVNKF